MDWAGKRLPCGAAQ